MQPFEPLGSGGPEPGVLDDLALPEEDRAHLRYLALHRIPEVLEKLTKGLLQDRPTNPLEYMAKQLRDMRAATKTKSIEEFLKGNSGNPNFRLSLETARETSRRMLQQEREESLPSEASTFSVTSVDMADFLLDLRQAYAAVARHRGGGTGRLSQAQLCEVIDYVAIPLPDNLVSELFSDIDVDREGTVDFEIFLARMSYKVLNRFSSEVLKTLFFSVTHDNNLLDVPGVLDLCCKLGLRLSDREIADLHARHSTSAPCVTVDEFQRLVHHHTAALPCPPPASAAPSTA